MSCFYVAKHADGIYCSGIKENGKPGWTTNIEHAVWSHNLADVQSFITNNDLDAADDEISGDHPGNKPPLP